MPLDRIMHTPSSVADLEFLMGGGDSLPEGPRFSAKGPLCSANGPFIGKKALFSAKGPCFGSFFDKKVKLLDFGPFRHFSGFEGHLRFFRDSRARLGMGRGHMPLCTLWMRA